MATMTLKLPSKLASRLDRLASRRGTTKSQLVRHAIERMLAGPDGLEVSAYDLMKSGCGVVRSGKTDLASNKRHLKGFGQ